MAHPATEVHRDVRLERLRTFHEALVGALGELGVGGVRLGEILSRGVTAGCAQCGFELTGEELAAAFAADDAHTAANPKHARLLQHYCARNGCSSYFYRFHLKPLTGVEWPGVLARAEARLIAAEELASEREREAQRATALALRRRLLIGAAVVGGLVALWAARRWWQTGALPGTTPPPKYQIDPSSVPAQPASR
ncbi:MAG: hypothetical protein IT580_17955 [Verrucomicrobiales bacterium]|nr:hypothetical protein [Verrucomicrobiales bacterium]